MHSIGYIHCDIKADNICVGNGIDNSTMSDFKLIDFGISESYTKDPDLFIEPKEASDHRELTSKPQRGNLIFSSPNSVNNLSLSRRDDLISLFYLLIYLQTNIIPFYKEEIPRADLIKFIVN